MNYATVDPGNTTIIATRDLDNRLLTDGANVRIPDFAGGERRFTIGAGAVPEFNLYDLTNDPTQCEPIAYYTRTLSYAYVGTPGVSGTVTETVTCNEIPIADLLTIKEGEVFQQDQIIRYGEADTSLAANWWIIVTQDARFEIDGINGNWLQRQQNGQGFPSGTNAPWIGIFNATTGDRRRVQVDNDANWETLYLEKTTHDQQTGNATDASTTALLAAYDDGSQSNFAAVAAHDPADPAWDYPATP